MSDLDMRIAKAVPPGGNWRDVPVDVPSERLAQIRVSAAAGQGSRSTYYGRLRPDRPAYTINTYYNRPGNGCFLHHDAAGGQHRTLSHREAARLQSFPDLFSFSGPQRAVCQQIGNAVPPLLGFQVARCLGSAGKTIDVFSGAGGLSLGFEWCGWQSLAAVDSDRHAVATFNANIRPVAFVGDMNDEVINDRLLDIGSRLRGPTRLALLGGPPCQGFSTGGNRRSSEDARNGLHARYAALVSRLRPDIFIFENVLGLLSMDTGRFVLKVLEGLRSLGYEVALWRLNAALFGIPQRRERVFIVGVPIGCALPAQPRAWTSAASAELFASHPVCDVAAALDDLPPLSPGQDGSLLPYQCSPESAYQQLMRGQILPTDFVGAGRCNDQGGRSELVRSVPGCLEARHGR
jgi:DNA (cytosine-5)-methyltransferase 1